MMCSTLSSYPIEEITATGAAVWFQLYWLRERDQLEQLIDARRAGRLRRDRGDRGSAGMARRLRDIRNGFALPSEVTAATWAPVSAAGRTGRGAGRVRGGRPHQRAVRPGAELGGSGVVTGRTEFAVDRSRGSSIHATPARAVDLGADAVVVSNHGGRQFDGAPASISALAAVVAEVAGRCEVLLDGGIRSGTDVLRALALGAAGVLLGRPLLWALAVDGEAGASGRRCRCCRRGGRGADPGRLP